MRIRVSSFRLPKIWAEIAGSALGTGLRRQEVILWGAFILKIFKVFLQAANAVDAYQA